MNTQDNALNNQVTLIKIQKTGANAKILFGILKKRTTNISQKSLPSYSAHKSFVLNHPYRVWYFVKQKDEVIGNAYILKNNCIGITIIKNNKIVIPIVIKQILQKHKPLKAIKSVRAAEFDFNVSPNNVEYISILEKMGAKLAQVTFVFDKNYQTNSTAALSIEGRKSI